MYVLPNYRSTRALAKALTEREMQVRVFSVELDPAPWNGDVVVEGPHYPERVQWRARVRVKDGEVVSVLADA